MKYLDNVIDNRWKFTHHFEMVSGKAERVLSRLDLLMPNLRSPKFDKQWREMLTEIFPDDAALYTRKLIVPHLEKWLSRTHGFLSYRLTQALTNHGCFSSYLYRIRKFYTKRCEFCPAGRNDAGHTVFRCEAWSYLREEVERRLRKRLSEGTLVESMLSGRDE
ncbi:uncharacterized protein LOC105428575 [Pogonomyrmex barbatus]|uniref:Uncharacterized protein LOC105428575 n=1 Tax=Pogonomyrmex barbatus TaxID=144034 RepID=A0A6I9X4E3_9HYME|nr:uncharacterized protein LOC105428575 [Pogonomyrmex barbatus]